MLENTTKERPRIDAKTLKALYFAWDTSDEAEENWKSIVEGTHPDISNLKEIMGREKGSSNRKTKTAPSILPQQQVTESKAEASSISAGISVSERIQQCQVVINKLKQSSKNLFSSRSNLHKRERKPLEKQTIKRRYNENQSDAEEIDWSSDDDNETVFKHKTIKLPTLTKRCLDVKLPVGPAKKFWSAEETRWLEEGVELYGMGNWAKILRKYNFAGRTSVNLKDKWRNLQKNN